MDSTERALGVLPTLEGDARGAYREARVLLEDGAPVGEPPLDGEVANEALLVDEMGGQPPWANRHSLALSRARRTRPPDKLILGSYVKPLKWSRPLADVSTPDQEVS